MTASSPAAERVVHHPAGLDHPGHLAPVPGQVLGPGHRRRAGVGGEEVVHDVRVQGGPQLVQVAGASSRRSSGRSSPCSWSGRASSWADLRSRRVRRWPPILALRYWGDGAEQAVDGFRLAFERSGTGPPWCCCTAGRATAPTTASWSRCCPPRGRRAGPARLRRLRQAPGRSAPTLYGRRPGAQRGRADREFGLERPVLVGYDVGSRVAQAGADGPAGLVRALVLAPPLPGSATGYSTRTRSASSGTSRSTG